MTKQEGTTGFRCPKLKTNIFPTKTVEFCDVTGAGEALNASGVPEMITVCPIGALDCKRLDLDERARLRRLQATQP